MKSLLIVRHAKSSWDFDLEDFDRPLNHRGETDAPEMAKRLLKKDLKIDLDEHIQELTKSFQNALSLAVEAVYINKESLPFILSKAKQHAISLSMESGYLSPDTTELVIAKASSIAGSLSHLLESKGFKADMA